MESQGQGPPNGVNGAWDLSVLKEDDFQALAVVLVPDAPTQPNDPYKALNSIPSGLCVKIFPNSEILGVYSLTYIPPGTRFGPYIGQIYSPDEVPPGANRKYFWRVYKDKELHHYIDGLNLSKSNWMRFVNPAFSSQSQNLIACQHKMQIYFYTIRPILPQEELQVWYCKEFAMRLSYPQMEEMIQQTNYAPFSSSGKEYEITRGQLSTVPPVIKLKFASVPPFLPIPMLFAVATSAPPSHHLGCLMEQISPANGHQSHPGHFSCGTMMNHPQHLSHGSNSNHINGNHPHGMSNIPSQPNPESMVFFGQDQTGHTNGKPFGCNNCGKKYVLVSSLRRHWKNMSCRPRSENVLNLAGQSPLGSVNPQNFEYAPSEGCNKQW